ncbi:hypothetical protein BN168_180005 [Clostridioides difficile CD002]|nr:hypothetical protein BN168_180005 [Clostridioides difficile CD002]CCL09369.1 hypothetical protein BN169_220005 [Clostridioides difficile E16]CCL40986.1 hypothetical protein BN177_210005 [Clostridioides difficile E24]CCL44743.1 hypothetical protein BN178_190005 [Clostridioides difficile T42]CCL50797.1 hypothetical protein BN179_2890004 [Clostridioides difficile T6]CCL54740.1 hypothetical protein BN180_2410003 [Clostridioides difficile E14]CCL58953.1 hypothetical protein BN181_4000004 [Clost
MTSEYSNQIRLIYDEPADWNATTTEMGKAASDYASEPQAIFGKVAAMTRISE